MADWVPSRSDDIWRSEPVAKDGSYIYYMCGDSLYFKELILGTLVN